MPQGAVGAHRFGTFGFAGHSKNPRPPQPGHGTLFSWDKAFFMVCIPNGQALPDTLRRRQVRLLAGEGRPATGAVPPACHEKPPNQRL
jgi:hypothetical protein